MIYGVVEIDVVRSELIGERIRLVGEADDRHSRTFIGELKGVNQRPCELLHVLRGVGMSVGEALVEKHNYVKCRRALSGR